MSETTEFPPENLLLPNDLERRQIFHLLKKASSYTAWERILGFYQKWADITEASVREADERGLLPKPSKYYTTPYGVKEDQGRTSIVHSDYVDIQKGLALFEEGVARLRKGDKRVFTYGILGDFPKACVQPDYWERLYIRGETLWDKETPLLEEFFEALFQLQSACGECSCCVLEERDSAENPARCNYGLWEMVFLPKLPYPDPLPEVPEPEKEIVITSGSPVSCSGIWEPVMGGSTKGWLFKKPQGPFTRAGPMNYLHGISLAPTLQQTYRDPRDKKYGCEYVETKVAWRLIWRDDRYQDGAIPEEEKDYQFMRPMPPDEEDFFIASPWRYLKSRGLPNPLLERSRKSSVSRKGRNKNRKD
ncbi:MAG: immunity 71 family protein [Helicobacteraceae bacterium]|jgi:hypothetical protein|nr:immunity 71 family protein [Helicobacteraceae bacterium]